MNNIHREKVERQFAMSITPNNLIPLYDVEMLVTRKKTEEISRDKLKESIEVPQTIRVTRDH